MHNLHFTLNINRLIAKYTKDDIVYKKVKNELTKNTVVLRYHLDLGYHLDYSSGSHKISNRRLLAQNRFIWVTKSY
jgi:hypothetical protein